MQVPDGVGGFAPSLSLTYSSNNGNGIAGYGWDIGGVSVVTRSPKTYYHDGTCTGVDLTSTDRFSIDGQRLICVSGSYGADNSVYRTEIDNFSKITCFTDGTSSPKRFLVKTKSGETIEFGYEGDSDQTIDGLTEEVSWYVDKRTDLYGNTIEYEYLKQYGHNYIGEIKYGPNTITFYYKERTDKAISYFVGATLEQNLLLDKVEMKYNSTVVKQYELKYNYYNTSPYYNENSVLNEVIEYGINNSQYNSTVFSYEYPTDNCNNYPILEYNSYISTDYTQYPGDFNGDGRMDIFTVKKSNLKDWRLYLATSTGGFTYSASGSSSREIDQFIATDLNGDGMDDLYVMNYMFSRDPNSCVEYGYAISSGNTIGTIYTLGILPSSEYFSDPHYNYSGDFDGDGINDCLKKLKPGGHIPGDPQWFMYTMRTTTLNSFMSRKYSGTIPSWGDKDYSGDFNGDGKTDIWIFDSNGVKIYTINGNSLTTLYSGSYPKKDHLFRLGDFNGDGKTDIFVYGSGSHEWSQWQFRLSTGTGFVAIISTKRNLI